MRRARIPVFAFQKVQAAEGAALVLSRDYEDAGRAAGLMAARIIRGETPASMPFVPFDKNVLIINKGAARAAGLTLPPALLARAARVIE